MMINKQKKFDALINALYKDVFRYAYWLCGNKTMAEDLVQETYLRAWRYFENIKDDKAAKSWLFTIVRRENARQYQKYQPKFVDIDDVSVEDANADLIHQLERHNLQKSIAQLKDEYKEPLMLQVIGGFSIKEIAKILSLNNNTVLTRLFRARNQLKEMTKKTSIFNFKGEQNG